MYDTDDPFDAQLRREHWEKAVHACRTMADWLADEFWQTQSFELMKVRAEFWGAVAALFALTDTTQHNSPTAASLDRELRFDVGDTERAAAFMQLQEDIQRVAEQLPAVPFDPLPDRMIWQPFFDLLAAMEASNEQAAEEALSRLCALPATNRNAVGQPLSAMPDRAWWLERAQTYRGLPFLPSGARV